MQEGEKEAMGIRGPEVRRADPTKREKKSNFGIARGGRKVRGKKGIERKV